MTKQILLFALDTEFAGVLKNLRRQAEKAEAVLLRESGVA